MSKKAEEAALKAFPKRKDGRVRGYTCTDDDVRRLYAKGYRKAEKDLGWHPVDESLPEIGEEVIVLIPYCRAVAAETQYQIISAQLIQPAQCMNTDEKIWNVPGVKFWMPMPKLPEE